MRIIINVDFSEKLNWSILSFSGLITCLFLFSFSIANVDAAYETQGTCPAASNCPPSGACGAALNCIWYSCENSVNRKASMAKIPFSFIRATADCKNAGETVNITKVPFTNPVDGSIISSFKGDITVGDWRCQQHIEVPAYPAPHYGLKDGVCYASCGGLGGTFASAVSCGSICRPDKGIAYDTPYCCGDGVAWTRNTSGDYCTGTCNDSKRRAYTCPSGCCLNSTNFTGYAVESGAICKPNIQYTAEYNTACPAGCNNWQDQVYGCHNNTDPGCCSGGPALSGRICNAYSGTWAGTPGACTGGFITTTYSCSNSCCNPATKPGDTQVGCTPVCGVPVNNSGIECNYDPSDALLLVTGVGANTPEECQATCNDYIKNNNLTGTYCCVRACGNYCGCRVRPRVSDLSTASWQTSLCQ